MLRILALKFYVQSRGQLSLCTTSCCWCACSSTHSRAFLQEQYRRQLEEWRHPLPHADRRSKCSKLRPTSYYPPRRSHWWRQGSHRSPWSWRCSRPPTCPSIGHYSTPVGVAASRSWCLQRKPFFRLSQASFGGLASQIWLNNWSPTLDVQ